MAKPERPDAARDRRSRSSFGTSRGGWSPAGRPRRLESDDAITLFGLHAVEAALNNPARAIKRLYLTENAERRIEAAVKARGTTIERVAPRDLDRRLGPDTVH
ncbi:MAG TPA: RNA methyltransferase substrate-binding domain-containing protein, partial [Hyphomicrobiaceae bacterium]|nr:RNA methyltransferase substrate-binding domain-containing protein [Hyphomicrobiaceae bacterium]